VLALLDAYGDHDGSVGALYDEGLAGYPPCAYVEAVTGDHWFEELGYLLPARRHYLRAAELDPTCPTHQYQLGLLYHMLGIPEVSVEHFRRAVALAGQDHSEVAARARFNWAAHLVNREHAREQAAGLLREALQLMPNYPEARDTLARLEAARPRGGLFGR